MATSIAKFDDSIVPHTIVYESVLSGSNSNSAATVLTDVTQGDAGSLISIDINNQWSGGRIYFQMTFSSDAPTNASEPDLQIPVDASSAVRIVIPEGIPFTKLSMWCTDSPGTAANTGAPGGNVLATIITT